MGEGGWPAEAFEGEGSAIGVLDAADESDAGSAGVRATVAAPGIAAAVSFAGPGSSGS